MIEELCLENWIGSLRPLQILLLGIHCQGVSIQNCSQFNYLHHVKGVFFFNKTLSLDWSCILVVIDLFQKLFRQDLLVASLFRNFLLAERIMRSYDCTPVSSPKLPPTYQVSLVIHWVIIPTTNKTQWIKMHGETVKLVDDSRLISQKMS